MSLYKDASLVMIPSAYKDGKLYSIRPVPEYGAEEITNGGFDTDSDWTKETGWTISGGKASYNGSAATSALYQNISATSGTTYRVKFSVVNYVSGSFKAFISNGSATGSSPLITANGDYVFDITATGILLVFRNVTSFNGSIDNVSVQEIVSSGDFDFSRGSNLAATRVDVNGLIEKGRENQAPYSNTYNSWVQTSVSLTSNQSGYDNSSDAWLIQSSATNSAAYINQNYTHSGVFTMSVYAKKGTSNWMALATTGSHFAHFDLENGVVGVATGANIIDHKIQSVGNGWYRCSMTSRGFSNFYVFIANGDNDRNTNSGDNIYIQDFQLEQGLVATDYIETGTSAAQSGILEDMPRLDYSGGASCPSLLLEPQRTNILTQSEYIGHSDWAGSGTTRDIIVTQTSEINPEGGSICWKIQGTSTNNQLSNNRSITSGSTITNSIYIKRVSGTGNVLLRDVNNNQASFSLSVADGWKRINVTATATSSTGRYYLNLVDYTDEILVWGAQQEEGSYPTSYIPTYGTSQTRSLDDCQAYNVESLLGTDSGTIFVDFEIFNTDNYGGIIEVINDSNLSERLLIWVDAGQDLELNISSGIGGQSIEVNNISIGRHKAAFTYSANEIAYFVDGTKIGTATPTLQAFAFSTYDMRNSKGGVNIQKKYINQTMAFPTALTDSECIALTTL